ncbi:MAG: DNA mismatch repair protein MutS [Deltaproteobacteria bacterium]|nr:MAG: DNA mismatch repair protein MutS [Deltaproteobacteria bacterium]
MDSVEELRKRKDLSMGLQSSLERVYDLERINSRLSMGSANARDLRALSESLIALKRLESPLSELNSPALKKIKDDWNAFEELSSEIASHIIEEPPFALKDGGLIREGVHAELDELRSLRQDAKSSIAAIEDREKKRTGITTLKVQYNRVFGYFIEVTASHLTKVPTDYIRKQTLANSERYITPELKEFEDKVMGADGRIKALEYEIFCSLREKALAKVPQLQAQAERVAELDAYLSLAHYARDSKGVRPQIEDSGIILIKAGRHPLVEKNIPAGSFVANDIKMDSSLERLMMITGPNMAGKSTIIRQTGVIALMAQVGAFVPAASAIIGIVDRIFTRVGAADRLARGESTFMVEMSETAHILHHATEKSLVLLDEIGRGTSTFDGVSIAWAVAEYLHDKIRARTMFATHYHELIDLAVLCPGIINYNVLIKEEGDDVTFLYRLVPGGMSHSYGIHVARLAGLPPSVVERAKEVLKNLEQGEFEPSGSPTISKKRKKNEGQFGLF